MPGEPLAPPNRTLEHAWRSPDHRKRRTEALGHDPLEQHLRFCPVCECTALDRHGDREYCRTCDLYIRERDPS